MSYKLLQMYVKLLHKLEELTQEELEGIRKKYPHQFTCVSCKELYLCNQGFYNEYALLNDEGNDYVIENQTCMECVNKLKFEVCKDEYENENGFWRILITFSHDFHYTQFTSWIKPVVEILRREFGEEDIYCAVKHNCDGYFSVFPFVDDTERYTKDNICHDLKIHKNKVYKRRIDKDYNMSYKQIGKY